jgi:hypothetical protein
MPTLDLTDEELAAVIAPLQHWRGAGLTLEQALHRYWPR